MSGSVSDTRSSPFVDYQNDIAYVGDDAGKLHKFIGVFMGTPTEAGSPWPFTVATGVILTGPVFDSGTSQNIFVAGSDGKLYCVNFAGAACSTPSITAGSGASGAGGGRHC
jgi:outer membrane protein assembly factor BamB